ncbi:MFS-type transporter [Penicillium ucsense]|uniref:MFS-type transporter n=1 Tax=Penicillium ucsense TaxID=2839758 RepID=A0A8J8WGP4_9EURO|nr:MFS-type transporter [Penicillium ucsense]KAF7734416.1 MFS-type transporter [Penicillium ucsense]
MALNQAITENSPLLGETIESIPASTGAIAQPDAESREPRNSEQQAKQPFPDASKQLRYVLPAISLGVFLSAADQTIIMASYGQIGSDLKALNLTSWIATSYFLTLTSFQPLYGKLSDIFGRKACLLSGYAIFGIGCLGCGLARNINELIAARVFQGIGGGGMTTVVSILMSDLVPLRDRGLWQGIINLIYATGSGVGAPLGGILSDYLGWRWAFLAQFPMCILAGIMVSLLLNLPAQESSHWKDKLRRVDFFGAIILVGAVLGFLLGLDRGSNVSWSLPLTIISLSVSAVLFIAFVLVEVCYAAEPFAPGHIIFSRTFFALYSCNFFSFGGWYAALFYLPLYFQAVDGVSATAAGLRLLPCILSGVCGSLLAGFIMRWTGKYFWLTVVAYGLLTAGCSMVYMFSGGILSSVIPMIIGTVFSSFGNGIGVTSTLVGLISNATPEDQAVATACSYLFRSLGSVIGLSLSSTVVQQLLREGLRESLRNSKEIDQIVEGVRESLDYIKKLDPQVAHIVRGCYGSAVNTGFAFIIAIVSLALFSAFFMREAKLNR